MTLAWSPRQATDDELIEGIKFARKMVAFAAEKNLSYRRELHRRYALKLEHLEIEQERRDLITFARHVIATDSIPKNASIGRGIALSDLANYARVLLGE